MELMARQHIKNLQGTFMYKNTSLFDFKIEGARLGYLYEHNRYKNYIYYPYFFRFSDTIEYGDINDYFKDNSVQDGAQDIRVYLELMGLLSYDLDELVKRTNGWNHIDCYWVRFYNFGATTFKQIKEQLYPIKTDVFLPDYQTLLRNTLKAQEISYNNLKNRPLHFN